MKIGIDLGGSKIEGLLLSIKRQETTHQLNIQTLENSWLVFVKKEIIVRTRITIPHDKKINRNSCQILIPRQGLYKSNQLKIRMVNNVPINIAI